LLKVLGLRLTFRVTPNHKAVGTYHLEVNEKLSSFIYNFELEKAITLLEEFDANAVSNDHILRAEMALMKLYWMIRSEEPTVWLGYASERVVPLVQLKVYEVNQDPTRTVVRKSIKSCGVGTSNKWIPIPKGCR
jgi:hypothetical protein